MTENNKIVTLDKLKAYTDVAKNKIDSKLGNKGNQILDGSLTTTGDLSIQGNLNVLGSTNTVNQETLTIKDNYIAINGDGSDLSTVGQAGIIAITGKNNKVIDNSIGYKLNLDGVIDYLGLHVAEDPYYGTYLGGVYSGGVLLDTGVFKVKQGDQIIDINTCGISYSTEMSPSGPPIGIEIWLSSSSSLADGSDYSATLGTINLDQDSLTLKTTSNDNIEIYLDNYIVNDDTTKDIVQKLFKDIKFVEKGQAYAAPIYNVEDESIKIGLGSYEKDGKGNITSFTFGAGQGQSIATRANNIKNNSLVKWDANTNKLKESSFSDNNGTLKVNNINVAETFISLNIDGTNNDSNQVGIISITGKEGYNLKSGDYTIDMDAVAKELGCKTIYDPDLDIYYLNYDSSKFKLPTPEYITDLNTNTKNKVDNMYLHTFGIVPPTEVYIIYDYLDEQGVGHIINHVGGVRTNTQNLKYNISDSPRILHYENLIISNNEVKEFCCKVLKKYGTDERVTESDFIAKGQAYAAPIYDKNEDTLKIGLGNYERDEQGNIKSFVFGDGQGQSIATRANNIEDGHLIKWDATQNKLVDAGDVSTGSGSGTSVTINGETVETFDADTKLDVVQPDISLPVAMYLYKVHKRRNEDGTYRYEVGTTRVSDGVESSYSYIIPMYFPPTSIPADYPVVPTGVLYTGDPRAAAHCANKKYVDAQINANKRYLHTYIINDYVEDRNSYELEISLISDQETAFTKFGQLFTTMADAENPFAGYIKLKNPVNQIFTIINANEEVTKQISGDLLEYEAEYNSDENNAYIALYINGYVQDMSLTDDKTILLKQIIEL